MAEEKKKSLAHRPRFLLFCVYVIGYVLLRGYGEIVSQSTQVQVDNVISRQIIIGSDPALPRWRRQVYRAVFSPCMVLEEEGRRLASEGKGIVQDVGDYGRDLLP